MGNLIRTIVTDFGWIHRSLGLGGNLTFLVGSVLFLPRFEEWKTTGVWLFIVGAALMLVGALGEFLVRLPSVRDEADDD
ncbi:YrhK family protein [Aurantiacibacter zhengii]|uniref:YrhK domain-containing protein n=1 Tax=Aurantiacibacter zhengii TaxID=2307003 RepID=A0A418NP48_9SPHN|nr:YrhK family protein [Aurantiacibacter zhengii]RIV83894.1 hypothetical protein D2V07_15545 [Aurantiacibacter zhengii]